MIGQSYLDKTVFTLRASPKDSDSRILRAHSNQGPLKSRTEFPIRRRSQPATSPLKNLTNGGGGGGGARPKPAVAPKPRMTATTTVVSPASKKTPPPPPPKPALRKPQLHHPPSPAVTTDL